MSWSLKIIGGTNFLLLPNSRYSGFNRLPCSSNPRHLCFQKLNECSLLNRHPRLVFSVNGESNAYGSSNRDNMDSNVKSEEKKDSQSSQPSSLSTSEILKKLKRYGIAGILSYGLLNTVYYTARLSLGMILIYKIVGLSARFYIAPAPGKMSYFAAVERYLKLMAMVWAGSQVTKLLRAGGALALAPFVDRGLTWFTTKFMFESQGKAFMAIVGFCFGLAFLLFLVITLLWAQH